MQHNTEQKFWNKFTRKYQQLAADFKMKTKTTPFRTMLELKQITTTKTTVTPNFERWKSIHLTKRLGDTIRSPSYSLAQPFRNLSMLSF